MNRSVNCRLFFLVIREKNRAYEKKKKKTYVVADD